MSPVNYFILSGMFFFLLCSIISFFCFKGDIDAEDPSEVLGLIAISGLVCAFWPITFSLIALFGGSTLVGFCFYKIHKTLQDKKIKDRFL